MGESPLELEELDELDEPVELPLEEVVAAEVEVKGFESDSN